MESQPPIPSKYHIPCLILTLAVEMTMIDVLKDVPKELTNEALRIRDTFIIDRNKLKEVTDRFLSEYRRGNSPIKEYRANTNS
jgi:hypothetical protein